MDADIPCYKGNAERERDLGEKDHKSGCRYKVELGSLSYLSVDVK